MALSVAPEPTEPGSPRDQRAFPLRKFLPWFLLVVAALHAAAINSHWWFQRDSALYVTLARSLAEDGTYTFNCVPHTLALPGLPLMLAPIYLTLGESFLAMNILMALFGLACVAIAHSLFRRVCRTVRHAAICTILLGLSFTLFKYSREILADVPFTFFALLALYCGVEMTKSRGRSSWLWCLAAGLAACAASSLRPFGPAVLIALGCALWLHRTGLSNWKVSLGKSLLIAAPWLLLGGAWLCRSALLRQADSPSYYGVFVAGRHPFEIVLHALRKVPDLLDAEFRAVTSGDLDAAGGAALALPMLVGLAASVRRGDRLLAVFGVVYLGGVCLGSPGRRHMLPMLPLFLFWLVEGADSSASWLTERLKWPSRRRLAQVGYLLAGIALALNIGKIGKMIYKAHSPDFYEAIDEALVPDYFELADWLKENVRPGEVVLVHEHRLVHYKARVVAWRFRKRWRNLREGELAPELAKMGVRYVVRDAQQDVHGRQLDRMFEHRPEAFEKVRSFGVLDLHRFDPAHVEETHDAG